MSDYDGAGKRRGEKPRGWLRRHWIGASVAAVLSVVLVGGATYAYGLMTNLDNIDTVKGQASIKEKNRPDPAPGEALNILVLGADAEADGNKNKSSIKADLGADGRWKDGRIHRSDTIMVAHISADRKKVSVISIPRDSWVTIYDEEGEPRGENKINAAFADYGPSGAIATVENFTDLRLDHMVIMDWDGFQDMTAAVGGVRVYIPETFYDSSQKVEWKKGWHNLKGKRALQYVRTRYGLTDGDFGRIKRQQNFIRLLLKEMMSGTNVSNPISLQKTVESVAANLTIDENFTTSDITGLALALRGVSVDDVDFLTVPLGSPSTRNLDNGMNVVNLDEEKGEELWRMVRNDKVKKYLRLNPDAAKLGSETEVS
ncbi:LCP family protein [Mumia sp. zg.B53]|uniref:LCP family protein n=1 Tax=unclassified Mumia TaxID=2621872 RepID=UPI001C6F40CC|nr:MULTISPECIES: LCP family protein [unclassified Mumia]MBW9210449.1 LCP family protein [Mumia sp. zg.B21]MBW9215071.1 LCP family protein [Mumia sp. zg.B53]